MINDIKKLITSIIILSVCFILIDVLVGHIGEIALKKLPAFGSEICKINYRLNKVKTDMIIVGSSRAMNHYNTQILADSINSYLGSKYTFYNAGIGGNFVDCNACTFESILNRYKPRLIIFETNLLEIKNIDWVKRMRRYETFYKNNSIVKDYLNRLGWNERIRVIINMHRFNSKAVMIVDNLRHTKKANTGYSPLYRIMNPADLKKEDDSYLYNNANDFSINNLTRMISLCKEMNVKLIISTSPRYNPNNNNELIHSLCNKLNTPYIELYNTDYFNSHPELFYDKNHLNDNGATIYTQMFFEHLKPHLTGL